MAKSLLPENRKAMGTWFQPISTEQIQKTADTLARRYDTAVTMLEKIQDEDDLTADCFRSILDAVHQEGPSVNTVYSNAFDLKHGIIYLYHWHQFDEVVKLNVAEEITKAPSPTRIRDLFSQDTVDQASKEYQAYQKKITAWENLLWAWLILAAASLVVLIWDLTHGTRVLWRMRMVWVLIVALFGPLGLMSYLYSYRQSLRSPDLQAAMANWKCAFGETMFGVVGYAIGIALAFSTFYLILSFSESSPLSLASRLYGLPLIVGLLFSRPRFYAFMMGSPYWNAVARRFLTEVISLNFVLVGMLPVGGILLSLCETHLGYEWTRKRTFLGCYHTMRVCRSDSLCIPSTSGWPTMVWAVCRSIRLQMEKPSRRRMPWYYPPCATLGVLSC